MARTDEVDLARNLLERLMEILRGEGETNWIRGVEAALHSLDAPDRDLGFQQARSIYLTMSGGRGAFGEFYIKRAVHSDQVAVNQGLDDVRDRLWRLFQDERT